MTQKDIDKLNQIKNNPKDYTKTSIKYLKNFSLFLWGEEVTNTIFDPNDTCFCSANLREQYKLKFFKKYNTEINNIQF